MIIGTLEHIIKFIYICSKFKICCNVQINYNQAIFNVLYSMYTVYKICCNVQINYNQLYCQCILYSILSIKFVIMFKLTIISYCQCILSIKVMYKFDVQFQIRV